MQLWIITGGIGTGKSSLIEAFSKTEPTQALRVFSADTAVHQAYESASIRAQIASVAGIEQPAAMPADFRRQVREALLQKPELKKPLEDILHPLVWKQRDRAAKEAQATGAKVLVAEIPLYYETGAALAADLVIVVAASRATQLSRLQAKRALDEHASRDMLALQLPLEEKIARADRIVWNDGCLGALYFQAHILLRQANLFHSFSMAEVLVPPPAPAPAAPEQPSPPAEAAVRPVPVETAASAEPAQPAKAQPPFPEEIAISDLQALTPSQLQALAESVGWRTNASRNKHQLIFDLMGWMGSHHTRIKVEGLVDIGSEGFGVIRYPKYSVAPLPEDVFVPSFVVRKFSLRCGQRVCGWVKPPISKDKYAAIDRITEIEDQPVDQFEQPVHFDKLTALFPSQRIILETPKDPSVSSRVVDIVAPLGKGQRAIIMASPRSGKTILLKDIAKSITINHPEISLIVLLLDERPEEVTDFEESVTGCEIYASTFDESPKRHTQVAELVLERAKRLVEAKKDVVILLDSITRLARGYNALTGGKGRTMSGGMDAKAIGKPKKFFGAARNVEEGGSLTIVGTALVETESKMDDLIFEEFKGTGNMEVCLDREMAERRIFPAIHVTKSGTRRDDLLYHPDEMRRIAMVRRQLAAVPAIEALETLIRNINRTKSNTELLLSGLK